MAANDITRVTVQIHYPQFGAEKEQNIHLSPAKAEALVAQKIFVDRGSKGYAYRLVINHKTEGKLALPWSAQVGDDYIYAAVPEDLLQERGGASSRRRMPRRTSSTAPSRRCWISSRDCSEEDHDHSHDSCGRLCLDRARRCCLRSLGRASAQQILLDKPVRAGELDALPGSQRRDDLLLHLRQAAPVDRRRTGGRSSRSCATSRTCARGADRGRGTRGRGRRHRPRGGGAVGDAGPARRPRSASCSGSRPGAQDPGAGGLQGRQVRARLVASRTPRAT